MASNQYPPWVAKVDYVTPLLKFLGADPAPGPTIDAPKKPKRGPPRKVADIKYRERLLKAIGEINSKNKKLTGCLGIAGQLQKRPEYCHLSERQLRRQVKDAIEWLNGVLKICPPNEWESVLRISPPADFTAKQLREKAFEFLRHRELMAKKQ